MLPNVSKLKIYYFFLFIAENSEKDERIDELEKVKEKLSQEHEYLTLAYQDSMGLQNDLVQMHEQLENKQKEVNELENDNGILFVLLRKFLQFQAIFQETYFFTNTKKKKLFEVRRFPGFGAKAFSLRLKNRLGSVNCPSEDALKSHVCPF